MTGAHAKTNADLEELIGELAEHYAERLRNGEKPSVGEYLRQYPEAAYAIRQILPTLEIMGSLARDEHPHDEAFGVEGSGRTLGDYRILGELGRGGMGVVYEAEQLSIGRRVALKVLPFAALLDQQQLNRFKNEARAAGTLDHPNIVAVHSVGTERGVHYYAMRLVEGQSLAEVIAARQKSRKTIADEVPVGDGPAIASEAEGVDPPLSDVAAESLAAHLVDTKRGPQDLLSTVPETDTQEYFRSAAQLGVQAAQALDHAHQNGIVHRDVKPGNLLIDAAGKLWVTDFGLARIESDASFTMTGDMVGTLRYMSPEQAQATRAVVDHRTDIYSLGATLYELLTLQPAVRGTDRQTLLQEIAEVEPISPGKINAAIPRDLVTIVGKSMEKRPEDRYRTAQELADDLTCFLQDRSIQAKPPTPAARVVKWTRRHTAAVWTSVAVSVLISLVLAISTALIFTAYRSEADQRQRAEHAYELADERFNLARRAVDDLYEGVTTPGLNSRGALTDLQTQLLERAMDFYQEIARQETLDTLSLEERGEVYLRLLTLHYRLAQWQEALAAAEGATKTFEALIRDGQDSPKHQHELGWAHNNAGVVLCRLGRFDEAAESYRKALTVFERLAIASPDDVAAQAGVARGYINLSDTGSGPEALAEGEQLARKGLNLARQAAEKDETAACDEVALIATGLLSDLLARQGRDEEAESLLRDAVKSCDAVVRNWPSMREMAGKLRSAWGVRLTKLGRLDEAETAYREGLKCLEHALYHRQSPADIIRASLRAYTDPSQTDTDMFQYMEPDIFTEHAETQYRLGQLLADQDQREEALRLLSESTRVLRIVLINSPGTPDYMDLAASSEQIWAELLREEAPERAQRLLRNAVNIRRQIVEIAPRHVDYRATFGDTLGQLGLILAAEGECAEARSVLEESIHEDELVLEIRPDHAKTKDHLAQHLSDLAWLLATDLGEVRDPLRAVELARRGVELAPEERELWTTLAMAQYRSGDWGEAVVAAEKAMPLSEGGTATDHLILAMAHWQLGQQAEARRWHDRAVEWMEKHKSEDKQLGRFHAEAAEMLKDEQE